MAEDELQRLYGAEQPLFVFHDQLVGAVVFGDSARGVDPDGFGFRAFALFVAGEIAVVYLAGSMRNQPFVFGHVGVFVECLFKPCAEFAQRRVAFIVVSAVVSHFVNEKQAQHLHANRLHVLQLGKVRGHCALDLKAHHIVLQAALRFMHAQHAPARKLNFCIVSANLVQDVAVFIHIAHGRFGIQVIAQFQGDLFALRAAFVIHIDSHLRADAFGFCINAHQLNKSLVMVIIRQHAIHLNLLNQSQVIGLHRVERVQQVIRILVGGGVAQGAQRVQIHQGASAHVGFKILWLIHDHERVHRLDVFNRRKGALAFLVDLVVVLGEAVHVDHQHAERIALRKMPQISELAAVIQDRHERHVGIVCCKVAARDL